ncbi:SAM-dependent methyltransferase [Leeuwenhoekiella palythoae]|uniref:SAM-dependent methyltransferase n=1 Tax=Leeuwenhoekiella palythoae TaxID=573501 RepID=UPI000C390316|nr:SAM-dependent methyltransferase [Leeuwenhoekiella palythoae]MBH12900.1 SAM-dependent methyltransferase [Leeuwenhoekiella sp.]UBZ10526.1 SAM-dependent methyltransferase [Leeuwenhoekiella palythoae]HAX15337.1 SAM-dependent methyltransferase [Leeuwenhoekiella sp.]HBO30664.1 SAM-dependent methyltransferase [Leeuwenhoekiella sp.]|tara:strand:+ start:2643 stop:3362 length:720 start_codon:yes stop_codon:yes gene_type:complete
MHIKSEFGKLYLIPVTLGDTPPLEVMPGMVQNIIETIDQYIVENEKTARRFIKQICPKKPQPSLKLHALNKHTDPTEIPNFLDACLSGTSMGLMSEAGVPGVADPGAEVVRIAHEKGIQVVPLVGPSSILMAMMSSGMNGQNFAFTGYLPIDQKEKRNELKRLERLSKDYNQAQLFIETPYRNNKMLDELCNTLNGNTRLCIACDITLPTEFIVTKPISVWKSNKPDLHKRPALFIIQH